MKQWLKTKHAIMFRLSNKVFQVDFLDSSQILLNT
jgi:polo-like kinase 1